MANSKPEQTADLILVNGQITTLNPSQPEATAVAIRNGRFAYVGEEQGARALGGDQTTIIDLQRKRVIPGLNDSHTHVIRGGLTYNAELRWEGVGSIGEALEMLREQALRTPPPQWVRIVGGWSEFQFKERRMPTLEEINEAAPDTPVFILHLYARALLNRAALRALGYDESPPEFDRGVIQRDSKGRPTGMLVAKPSALILYKSLASAPPLTIDDQVISTRHFMRELNRLGVTSAIDAGGGGQNFPDDYAVIKRVREAGQSTLRLAYNLFAQVPGKEYDDYVRWVELTKPGDGDEMLKCIGAGENLVWSAADFENFLEPRPELVGDMETQLEKVVRLLAERHWPFRIHATYDESIQRFLRVFEKVSKDVPFDGMHWMIDHAETITQPTIERIGALGGGIAIQHRMAFQGEYFIDRYGDQAVRQTPPIRKMLELGVPVGAGTDATRVASYNPWVALYWLSTGKTLGGTAMYADDNILSREEALELWTTGSSWFSTEDGKKGAIVEGQLADLAVLSADYFAVEDEDIKRIESVLTVVDGKVVYAGGGFEAFGPGSLPISPDWSPVGHYGGDQSPTYHGQDRSRLTQVDLARGLPVPALNACRAPALTTPPAFAHTFGFGLGCDCFAF